MCISICIVFVEMYVLYGSLDYGIVKSVCMLGVEIICFFCSIEIVGCVGRVLYFFEDGMGK